MPYRKEPKPGGRKPPELDPDTGKPIDWGYLSVTPREIAHTDTPWRTMIFPKGNPRSDLRTWCCLVGHETKAKGNKHARSRIKKGRVRLYKFTRKWDR